MNIFVDCPCCGSEFIVSEEISVSRLRCPDCLQWVNSMDDYGHKNPVMAYASNYDDDYNFYYDEKGYQAGYDY